MTEEYEIGTVVMNTAKGSYSGKQGKIVGKTKRCYRVFLFSDKKEHLFRMEHVVEVVPEETESERVVGRKVRRTVEERRCDTDTLVMAFHKGLPTTATVSEAEFDELVVLLKMFFLEE